MCDTMQHSPGYIAGSRGRCAEIRQGGPVACGTPKKMFAVPCNIASSMWRAEAAWRAELAKVSIAKIVADASLVIDETRKSKAMKWLEDALQS